MDTKLKTWYKSISKTTTEQLQWAKEAVAGKAPPVDNDPLEADRRAVDAYHKVCVALKNDVEKLTGVMEAMRHAEKAAIETLAAAQSTEFFGHADDLAAPLHQFVNSHVNVNHEVESTLGTAQHVAFELKTQMGMILSVQKRFELRDKLHRKMLDEARRLERAKEIGDPKIIEKRQKAERAECDFHGATMDLKSEVEDLAAGRYVFIARTLHQIYDMSAVFYTSMASAFTPKGGSRPTSPAMPTEAALAAVARREEVRSRMALGPLGDVDTPDYHSEVAPPLPELQSSSPPLVSDSNNNRFAVATSLSAASNNNAPLHSPLEAHYQIGGEELIEPLSPPPPPVVSLKAVDTPPVTEYGMKGRLSGKDKSIDGRYGLSQNSEAVQSGRGSQSMGSQQSGSQHPIQSQRQSQQHHQLYSPFTAFDGGDIALFENIPDGQGQQQGRLGGQQRGSSGQPIFGFDTEESFT